MSAHHGKAGIWDRIMDAITISHGGNIRMIDGTSVRVHHSAAALLADKAYDADWLRATMSDRGGWANIPPKSNCKSPIVIQPIALREAQPR